MAGVTRGANDKPVAIRSTAASTVRNTQTTDARDRGNLILTSVTNMGLMASTFGMFMHNYSKDGGEDLKDLTLIGGSNAYTPYILFCLALVVQLGFVLSFAFDMFKRGNGYDWLKTVTHIFALVYFIFMFIWILELPLDTFSDTRVIIIIITLGGLGLNVFSLITRIPQALMELNKNDGVTPTQPVVAPTAQPRPCDCSQMVTAGPVNNIVIEKVVGGGVDGDDVTIRAADALENSLAGSRMGLESRIGDWNKKVQAAN